MSRLRNIRLPVGCQIWVIVTFDHWIFFHILISYIIWHNPNLLDFCFFFLEINWIKKHQNHKSLFLLLVQQELTVTTDESSECYGCGFTALYPWQISEHIVADHAEFIQLFSPCVKCVQMPNTPSHFIRHLKLPPVLTCIRSTVDSMEQMSFRTFDTDRARVGSASAEFDVLLQRWSRFWSILVLEEQRTTYFCVCIPWQKQSTRTNLSEQTFYN